MRVLARALCSPGEPLCRALRLRGAGAGQALAGRKYTRRWQCAGVIGVCVQTLGAATKGCFGVYMRSRFHFCFITSVWPAS